MEKISVQIALSNLELKTDSANPPKEDSEQVRANFEEIQRRATELGTTKLTQFNQFPREKMIGDLDYHVEGLYGRIHSAYLDYHVEGLLDAGSPRS